MCGIVVCMVLSGCQTTTPAKMDAASLPKSMADACYAAATVAKQANPRTTQDCSCVMSFLAENIKPTKKDEIYRNNGARDFLITFGKMVAPEGLLAGTRMTQDAIVIKAGPDWFDKTRALGIMAQERCPGAPGVAVLD